MEKTHWKKAFNKDYLGSHDLDDNKDLVAVIDHVEVKEVKDTSGKSEKRNIAIFKGKIKPMVLNVTNCKSIKKFACSNYIEDWKDISVQIYVKTIKAFNEEVDALRIRDRQPKTEKEELTPEHPRWKDAVDYLSKSEAVLDNVTNQYKISKANIELLQTEAL